MNKNQKIVIVCGPDMTGKTQIAKALAKKLGATYYKASTEHKKFTGDQTGFLSDLRYADPARLDLIKQSGMSVVFDRGYPCEHAYSHFFGRKTDKDMLLWLDDEYARLGARIVFATRKSFEGIHDDLNKDIGPKQLTEISFWYEHFLLRTNCKTLMLYVDDEDLDRELRDIMLFMGDD